MAKAMNAIYGVQVVPDENAGFTFSDGENATKFAEGLQRHAQQLWRHLEKRDKTEKMPGGLPLKVIAQPIDADGEPKGDPFVISNLKDE